MPQVNNKMSANSLAKKIIEEIIERFNQLSTATDKNEQLAILAKIEKDSKIAMLLGNNEACFFLAKSYNWTIENFKSDKGLCEHACNYHKVALYIGSELGNRDCSEIKKDSFQKITKETLNKKVAAIKETQEHYSNKVLYNNDQVKEEIYNYYIESFTDNLGCEQYIPEIENFVNDSDDEEDIPLIGIFDNGITICALL